ncbi:MAG: type secretion system rane protein PorP/SprF [Ferruginibacter sp.]|uniref:PorP/SprF family type IX secretion system membrane protein n=1 Tax=Ferruginibacter sp. TaxID=1940288 RepID=UPI002658C09E|nr:PorP/SprF family type IX secretion system membrane protein [Ferruginibacter sp.]MDB5278870.1 type secretion system rane protein PorP/SprF [Ferruginibacter sp.]
MKGRINILLIIAVGLQITTFVQAQDLHFSQFFNNPLTTNPANTGFIPDADYRLGASYRNQYSSVMATPYQTVSVFGDAQVLRNQIEYGWLGIGGFILSDVAGSGGLRSTKVYGSLAYHQMLGSSSLLTAGFNLGWANKRIDQTKLKFPDQFDGKFFDSNTPTDVVLVNNNVSYFDMQVGMNYAYFPNENVYFNGGYSIHHVNRPQETFFNPGGDSTKIPVRHIGFLNALLKVDERVILNPNAYYTMQAKSSELVLGLNANYNLSGAGGDMQLLAGLYYRAGDAIVPMVGFELKHVRFTFSYDATTSALRNYNNMQGASEFNIMKKGFYGEASGDTRQVICPRF